MQNRGLKPLEIEEEKIRIKNDFVANGLFYDPAAKPEKTETPSVTIINVGNVTAENSS